MEDEAEEINPEVRVAKEAKVALPATERVEEAENGPATERFAEIEEDAEEINPVKRERA